MLEFLFFLNTLLPEFICTASVFWRSADRSRQLSVYSDRRARGGFSAAGIRGNTFAKSILGEMQVKKSPEEGKGGSGGWRSCRRGGSGRGRPPLSVRRR